MRRNIGKMRHPIELYEPARNSDGAGGFTRGEAKVASAWAQIKPMSTAEQMKYAKLEEVRTHKAAIRVDDRFIQGRYLKYDGRIFHIEGVTIVDEIDRFMELELREDTRT